ncbi:MAG: hypothetical protein ABEK17_04565 [Candidatus Aenigmatarchaeota archaeon]
MLDKKTKNKLTSMVLFLIFLVVFSTNVIGSMVEIDKFIDEMEVNARDPINVTLNVENNDIEKFDCEITDLYPEFAGVIGKETDKFSFVSELNWNFTLNPGESKKFSYLLNLSGIPHSPTGRTNVTIPAATLKCDNLKVKSESYMVNVLNITQTENCNYNFECEPELGENSNNCVQDCPISGKDNYCDSVIDMKCDPDCNGTDPDCYNGTLNVTGTTSDSVDMVTTTSTVKEDEDQKTLCGNDVCEAGEDKENCPEDCESGFPYYILWVLIAIIVLFISIMIIYQSKEASGGYR